MAKKKVSKKKVAAKKSTAKATPPIEKAVETEAAKIKASRVYKKQQAEEFNKKFRR